MQPVRLLASFGILVACWVSDATGQTNRSHEHAEGVPGRCEAPAVPGSSAFGCYFDAALDVGSLPREAYWHIDEYPDRGSALAARTSGGAVVEAFGRIFLQTVNGDAGWRPAGAKRLARVGPLAVPPGVPLTARLMEATTPPGAMTRRHRHSGPEGFFVLDGEMCLETPAGAVTVGPGDFHQVAAGEPMRLTSTGSAVRRSLVLVLHPTGQPWMTGAPDWKPKGLCEQTNAVAPAQSDDEAALRAIDERERAMVAAGDTAGLAALAHPNLVINAPLGRVLTREQFLANMAGGQIAAEQFERTAETVRVSGSTGVVMGREIFTPAAGSELARTFGTQPLQRRYTNIYVREGGRWLWLARHANVLPASTR